MYYPILHEKSLFSRTCTPYSLWNVTHVSPSNHVKYIPTKFAPFCTEKHLPLRNVEILTTLYNPAQKDMFFPNMSNVLTTLNSTAQGKMSSSNMSNVLCTQDRHTCFWNILKNQTRLCHSAQHSMNVQYVCKKVRSTLHNSANISAKKILWWLIVKNVDPILTNIVFISAQQYTSSTNPFQWRDFDCLSLKTPVSNK